MDTINIINNFDQKLLMSNILVLNQKKILDTIIEMFDYHNYNSEIRELINDMIEPSEDSEYKKKSIQKIIDIIDKQKTFNWEMFVDLINLDTSFYYRGHQTKSLYYLVEKQETTLLYFLLNLDEGIIRWNIKLMGQESNIFITMIKKLWWGKDLMRQIINSSYFINMLKEPNQQTALYLIVSKCSEYIIMEAVDLKLLDINWKDTNSNQLIHWACKRNLMNLFDYLLVNNVGLENENKQRRRPIHLACIKNNYPMVKSLIECGVNLEQSDTESNKPIDYAIKYGNCQLVQLFLDKQLDMENDLIYDVIEYQGAQTINWFLENKPTDLYESSFIWVAGKLMLRNLYKQTLSYSIIKINKWITNYINNCENYIYIEGRCFYDPYVYKYENDE